MNVPRCPIGGASAWTAAQMNAALSGTDSWLLTLDPVMVADLIDTVRTADASGLGLTEIDLIKYPLESFATVGRDVLDALLVGRGFVVLRGVPVGVLSERQAELAHWLIGQLVGIPIVQNNAGELLVHVRDQGLKLGDHLVRGYQTSAKLDFHVDSSDVVALLCRLSAKVGGASAIISSTSIHDRLAETAPDQLETLYQPFWFDRRNGDGPESFYRSPVVSARSGRVALRYGRTYIESAGRGDHVPALTPTQVDALDALDAVIQSPDLVLHMDLLPGDIQFLNNYVIMHARTEYEDWAEPARRRDMVRLWLTLVADLDLDPIFAAGGITPRSAAFGGGR